jgi:hypothetical protein
MTIEGAAVAVKKTDKKATKKSPKKKKPAARKGNHFLILIIMLLTAALLFLVNKQYFAPGKGHSQGGDIMSFFQNQRKNLAELIRPDSKSPEKKEIERAGVSKVEKKKEPHDREKETPKKIVKKPLRVKVYFLRVHAATNKVSLVPVSRTVSAGIPLKETIEKLISGPSSAEKRRGILTALPGNIRVNRVSIKGKSATIDFNSALGQGGGANILISRLDQVIYTATQFDDIATVYITINGKQRKTLGGEGLSIAGPLKRR